MAKRERLFPNGGVTMKLINKDMDGNVSTYKTNGGLTVRVIGTSVLSPTAIADFNKIVNQTYADM